MYWNLNAHKILDFKTPEKWTIVLMELYKFSKTQILEAKPTILHIILPTAIVPK